MKEKNELEYNKVPFWMISYQTKGSFKFIDFNSNEYSIN